MLKSLVRFGAITCALLMGGAAMAQGVVQQVGPVVPGDAVVWSRNGQIMDGGATAVASTGSYNWTGKQTFGPSTTASASVNVSPGAAPVTPVDGDVWTTSTGVYARVNGVTVGPFFGTSSAPANTVFAAPNGASGVPSFRALTAADMAALLSSSNTFTNTNTFSQSALVTTQTVTNGSVGQGAYYALATRTGGYGEYGHALCNLQISAATPNPQFDVCFTGWSTSGNLTGGSVFGSWLGANTPSNGLGQTFTGGAAIGAEINYGNRWADFGLQTDIGGTRYTSGLQVVPDVLPAQDGLDTKTVTGITIASPAVVTVTSHGFTANMGVVFGGAGTLPTGLTAGTTYYVLSTGLAANTFQVSTSIGGTAVNTTGAFSAPITVLPSWPGSFGVVTAPSIHGHQTYVGELTRYDAITLGGYTRLDHGGSIATDAPLTWTKLDGYYGTGLDCSAASFSTFNCINLSSFQAITGGAFYGSATNVAISAGTGALRTAGGLGVALSGYAGNSFVAQSFQSYGAAPTLSGTCTPISTQVGGNTAGSLKMATACAGGTLIFTFTQTATNGYSCNIQDMTTPANTLKQTAYTSTTATFTGTTVLNDIVVFQCMAF